MQFSPKGGRYFPITTLLWPHEPMANGENGETVIVDPFSLFGLNATNGSRLPALESSPFGTDNAH